MLPIWMKIFEQSVVCFHWHELLSPATRNLAETWIKPGMFRHAFQYYIETENPGSSLHVWYNTYCSFFTWFRLFLKTRIFPFISDYWSIPAMNVSNNWDINYWTYVLCHFDNLCGSSSVSSDVCPETAKGGQITKSSSNLDSQSNY